MPVTIDPSGRRSVRVQTEVPGTPNEVWEAIATGPGVSSWFVPTKFDFGPDGQPTTLVCHFGEGMDANAVVKEWNPPRRFLAESNDFAPGGPPVATEWTVDPQGDNACLVTVEHSLQSDSDDWDANLEGTESGWPAFFTILRLRMAHFRDEPHAVLEQVGMAAAPDTAWADLAAALNLTSPAVGEHRSSPEGAPSLSGVIESIPNDSEVLMRVEEPAPGVAHLFALPLGEATMLSIRLHLYAPQAADTANRKQAVWQSWMQQFLG